MIGSGHRRDRPTTNEGDGDEHTRTGCLPRMGPPPPARRHRPHGRGRNASGASGSLAERGAAGPLISLLRPHLPARCTLGRTLGRRYSFRREVPRMDPRIQGMSSPYIIWAPRAAARAPQVLPMELMQLLGLP